MKNNSDLNNKGKRKFKLNASIIIAILFLILAASILNYYSTKAASKSNNVTNAINDNLSEPTHLTSNVNTQ